MDSASFRAKHTHQPICDDYATTTGSVLQTHAKPCIPHVKFGQRNSMTGRRLPPSLKIANGRIRECVMDWVHLAQGGVRWRAIADTLTNHRVPYTQGNCVITGYFLRALDFSAADTSPINQCLVLIQHRSLKCAIRLDASARYRNLGLKTRLRS
jgi:hypothetical protein